VCRALPVGPRPRKPIMGNCCSETGVTPTDMTEAVQESRRDPGGAAPAAKQAQAPILPAAEAKPQASSKPLAAAAPVDQEQKSVTDAAAALAGGTQVSAMPAAAGGASLSYNFGVGEWDPSVEEWLVTPGGCSAGALGSFDPDSRSVSLFAAAPTTDAGGWKSLWYALDDNGTPYQATVNTDDGGQMAISVDEQSCLGSAVALGTVENGLWVGGLKFSILQHDKSYSTGEGKPSLTLVLAKRPGEGLHIAKIGDPASAGTVIIGKFTESLGQTSMGCRAAVLDYAEHLAAAGF